MKQATPYNITEFIIGYVTHRKIGPEWTDDPVVFHKLFSAARPLLQ